MTEAAFPLAWPAGWPRTDPAARRFSLPGGRGNTPSWDRGLARLGRELDRLGAGDVVVSTNQPLRRDGQPAAARGRLDDPGAAVYFTRAGRRLVLAQDGFELLADNLRSIALAIEHLRGLERHGGDAIMERAFTGFAALPPPAAGDRAAGGAPLYVATAAADWRRVLGAGVFSLAEAEARYRRLARERHPDMPGGSAAAMTELNAAILAARLDFGGRADTD